MLLNYHYNTVKTLALHGGFSAADAQYIAYFSQQVDDFVMHAPFILDAPPPAFFLENRLARPLRIRANRWAFLPCATGISMLRTMSGGYRLHTLVPFHFIMPQPFQTLAADVPRNAYRCVSANRGAQLLINQLLREVMRDNGPQKLLKLGMLLHTFADTYAHEGFSGLQGWENAAHVREGMRPAEAAFFRALPSIGHANAGSVPDDVGAVIDIHAKQSEKDMFASFIKRDNSIFFADCSRRILDIFCTLNKKSPPNNQRWDTLQTKLARAQQHDTWAEEFPQITYDYRRDEFLKIQLHALNHDTDILLHLPPDALHDIYNEEADHGRLSALTLARQVNADFFHYNEAAYRHVHAVTGAYTAHGFRTQLDAYGELAEATL